MIEIRCRKCGVLIDEVGDGTEIVRKSEIQICADCAKLCDYCGHPFADTSIRDQGWPCSDEHAAHWKITSRAGVEMGVYPGHKAQDALDAMARDAGYRDHAEVVEVTGTDFAGCIEKVEGGTK